MERILVAHLSLLCVTCCVISYSDAQIWRDIIPEEPGKELSSLKSLLMQYDFFECCPSWKNLTTDETILDELKRKRGPKAKPSLRTTDLLVELKRAAFNITSLSIEGQQGMNEAEKYYNFYDSLQYYFRLTKVAHNYLDLASKEKNVQELESERLLRRLLNSIEFRVDRDKTLQSFIEELSFNNKSENATQRQNYLAFNKDFELYEDFIRFTKFGQQFASNLTFVSEEVLVFDEICQHLSRLNFPSNFTRPSKQYEMIRKLSRELFLIRHEVIERVSPDIRRNHEDVKRLLTKLEDLTEARPSIRMLGDEFSEKPPFYGSHVRRLTNLLDSYTTNNMTEASFYEKLSELPEDFIVLGSSIAREYESKELQQHHRYDSDYFTWLNSMNKSSKVTKASNSSANSQNGSPNGGMRSGWSFW